MKKLVIFALVLAVAGLVVWATTRTENFVWTTCCDEARAEFEAAVEASRRFYHDESARHLYKAIEIDPNFAMARLFLAQLEASRTRERSAIIEVIESVDVRHLNPRERLLFEIARARSVDQDPARVASLLESYLHHYPDDPYAIELSCERAWLAIDRGPAEACYRRLLELEPNWVSAQNRLGYLALAEGRFADAEERFITYRYIAPDQANPHDSLGELLMVQGRWEEAETSLFRALATHPEFCVSWQNLSDIGLYRDDLELALRRIDEAKASEPCRNAIVAQWCRVSVLVARSRGEVLDETARTTCANKPQDQLTVAHREAIARRDFDEARRIEDELKGLGDYPGEDKGTGDHPVDFARMVRFIAEQDWPAALEVLESFDRKADLGTQRSWFERMMVDLGRARVLRALGRDAEATAVEQEVAAVNPEFAALFRSRCTERAPGTPPHLLCPAGSF